MNVDIISIFAAGTSVCDRINKLIKKWFNKMVVLITLICIYVILLQIDTR